MSPARRARSAAEPPSSLVLFQVLASRRLSRARSAQLAHRTASSCRSSSMSACSETCGARTDTDSPTAIDIEPATSPATPAFKLACLDAEAAATPTMRLAVHTIASFEPSTAARSHPGCLLRCASRCHIVPPFTSELCTLISRVLAILKNNPFRYTNIESTPAALRIHPRGLCAFGDIRRLYQSVPKTSSGMTRGWAYGKDQFRYSSADPAGVTEVAVARYSGCYFSRGSGFEKAQWPDKTNRWTFACFPSFQ